MNASSSVELDDQAGDPPMKPMDSLAFHKARYAEEFAMDEQRWSRIGPCLEMIRAEQRRQGCKLAILDVGCGDGTVSRLFLEAGKVFGVDIVPDLVERAIEKGIEAKTADVTTDGLPFSEGELDAIYAGALIEHLYDSVLSGRMPQGAEGGGAAPAQHSEHRQPD